MGGCGPLLDYCACTYDACAGDANCPDGGLCACHGSQYTLGLGNTCVPGNCHVDADCQGGAYCSPSADTMVCSGCALAGYYCHTPRDLCNADCDCWTDTDPFGWFCAYSTAQSRWECQDAGQCG
jgi:hypothetical protein